MAKRAATSSNIGKLDPSVSGFQNPIPQGSDLYSLGEQYAKAYGSSYDKHSFLSQHPFVAGALGLATMGPAGAFALPMSAKRNDATRHADLVDSYNTVMSQLLESQKSVDAINAPRNDAQLNQALIDVGRRTGNISPDAPDLYQRNLPSMDGSAFQQAPVPVYSKETLDNMRKGLFGASDIQAMMDQQDYQTARNYNLPSQKLGSSMGQPGVTTSPDGTTTLNAGVETTQNVDSRPNLPFFVSDPQTMMQQITSAGNNALQEGQKRYQFDQEEPKRMAEVKKALAEGDAAKALAILRGAQTKTEQQRPALIKAQTGEANASASLKNRTDPNLRGGGGQPNALSLMNPTQQQAYLDKMAGLAPDRPSIQDAYQQASLEGMAQEKDWSGKPTPKAMIAQQALSRLGGAPQAAVSKPAPAARTMQSVTLPSGKQVNF